ncbi:large neutral amino acids transporter small subunit 2-like [Haliotis rufescens]|uniref:large neutral amino acids transporter small subunit 2-like n=1 Tax=Haliotis rufescens TaxID=6454 RepID=UPI001EB0687C|nr:large neutral amino acids transporter small subunit 2-like [Haliotis rufescens]
MAARSNGTRILAQELDSKPEQKVQLKKQITLFHCVSIIVGIIIGAGIFVSPVGILYNVHSVGMSCVLWALCGVYSTLCALCFAELGASIPESGGEYVYIKRAFGDCPAFLCLWVNLIILCPVGVAAASLIFATYTLRPVFPDCDPPSSSIRLLAAIIIILLIALNCMNVKWATKVQAVITTSKLIALFIIIIIGFMWLGKGETAQFENSFEGSDYSAGAIAVGFYSGFWAFGGWNYLNFLCDEVIDPHRNVPRAIVISMTIVTSVYITANIAYFAVLTPAEMLDSTAVAVTFSARTVPVLQWIMPVLIAVSVIGAMNGSCLSMSRLFFAGAKHNHLPSFISMITLKHLTPAPSLIVILILTLLMQCFENIFYLIEMMGFSFATVLCAVLAGQVYLRWKEPDMPRPIKLPVAIPIFLFMVSVLIFILTIYQKPNESGVALLLMLLGLPVYVIGTVWSKPASVKHKLDSLTRLIQLILIVLPVDKDDNSD